MRDAATRVRAWNLSRRMVAGLSGLVATRIGRASAWLSGVTLGSKCKFYGYTKFQVAANGSTFFGDCCVFRSGSTSNLIGINRPCIFSVGRDATLRVGTNCGFSGTVIGCFSKVTLGNNVRCGANTLITDGDWHLEDPRAGLPLPVLIDDNVWLGVNVTVLKGVVIGENSVIGAGSVVTRSIPPNVVAAGNPCRVVKELV